MGKPPAPQLSTVGALFASTRSLHGQRASSMLDPDFSDDGLSQCESLGPSPLLTVGDELKPAVQRHPSRRIARLHSASAVAPYSIPEAAASPPPPPRDESLELRRTSIVGSSVFSRYASALATRFILADKRVVKYGLSLPIIFVLSMAIGVSYALAFLSNTGTEWIPRDLTGADEWTSYTRTHMAQDPAQWLDDLLSAATIGVDTSVGVSFLSKYAVANEVHVASTAATFNKTRLDADFILANGFVVGGQMAGAFEGFGAWPCAAAIAEHPIVSTVCPDPQTDWFAIAVYNNPVTTTAEKASTYLAVDYTPMALMTARIWPAMAPKVLDGAGIVVRGYKEGTYTERQHFLLKLENGQLALAQVTACDRATQSNAFECDHLENEDIYVRNYATRDFEPLAKLAKLKVYGPAFAMGNYVAADKNYVQLPASAIVMTDAGYSATTLFSTTFPFRMTIAGGKLTAEYSIPQVAAYTNAVGNSFATATAQMVVVCLMVFNSIAHCRTSGETVRREGRIFGFQNSITMGIVARRLGTYKLVSLQLCIYHALNVRRYFAAVYYDTQKTMDSVSFGSEGVLLMVVCTMMVDQLIFFERYSSVRETLTVVGSGAMYLVLFKLNRSFFLTSRQVQVTQLEICAHVNQCYVIRGYEYYYVGLFVSLLVPVAVVNLLIDRWLVRTRAPYPRAGVGRAQLTSFERFCVGLDARLEFGDFTRESGTTPLSVVHAAGFTYVGPYLVRIKDYYLVVLARWLPEPVIKSSGLTLSLFRIRNGEVVAGRHMLLGAAYKYFRNTPAGPESYRPIR